ncbi:MAG: sulfite exporter TauE/SafE family protein [Elusimicrobia bacterium]|nr:sulfite exporter TauE/SafE family protein [Elusimicrobiota bacterium]
MTLLLAAGTAFWLGLLTSISPCPLASNITAVSFLGRNIKSPTRSLLNATWYCLGRMLAYIVLGVLITKGLLAAPSVSFFLERHANQVLGPILILAGMFLSGLLEMTGLSADLNPEKLVGKNERLTALTLGFVFALSFCPVSAALFFGSLIPLALRFRSPLLLPSAYGFGSGLPVLAFAFFIAFGLNTTGQFYDSVTRLENWAKAATAGVFIAAGLYISAKYALRII